MLYPDLEKQAVELIFSRKQITADHPNIVFNNTPVKKVDEQKHLGIILSSNWIRKFSLLRCEPYHNHQTPIYEKRLNIFSL